MARLSRHQFDISDVDPPEDYLDDVIDIACEVVREHAPDHGSTRVERLARWTAANLGGFPYNVMTVGAVSIARLCPGFQVERAGVLIGVTKDQKTIGFESWVTAREVAVALLRMAELAEQYSEVA